MPMLTHRVARMSARAQGLSQLALCGLLCALLQTGCDTPAEPASGGGEVSGDLGGARGGSGVAGQGEVGQGEAGQSALLGGYFEGSRYVREGTHANVVRTLRFMALEEEGVARGFDLDGRVSADGEEESCGHGDFTSPEGRAGVDNQLAELWEAIAPLVGEQAHALLQNAVNEGRVLLMIELEGLEDLQSDDDLTLRIFKGTLRPEIGTLGVISPDQSFDLDYGSPISSISGVKLEDGQLIAGPFDVSVPVTILSLDAVVKLELGHIQLKIDDEGRMEGFITGAVHVPTLTETLINTDAEQEARLVAPFFERNADMVKVDGVCTYLSMGLSFEATRAFVIRDRSKESP